MFAHVGAAGELRQRRLSSPGIQLLIRFLEKMAVNVWLVFIYSLEVSNNVRKHSGKNLIGKRFGSRSAPARDSFPAFHF